VRVYAWHPETVGDLPATMVPHAASISPTSVRRQLARRRNHSIVSAVKKMRMGPTAMATFTANHDCALPLEHYPSPFSIRTRRLDIRGAVRKPSRTRMFRWPTASCSAWPAGQPPSPPRGYHTAGVSHPRSGPGFDAFSGAATMRGGAHRMAQCRGRLGTNRPQTPASKAIARARKKLRAQIAAL
jgi:hypothetical protein